MTTVVGIDAATQPKKIGLARGRLGPDGTVVIEESVLGSSVESVPEKVASWVCDGPALLAIDAPLGWPAPLARGLREHRAGQRLEGEARDLFRRTTDLFVHETLGKLPLEVGADRIARTAHSALRLLDEVRARTGLEIPLAWSPEVVGIAAIEVYPAATLLGRRAGATGYKGSEPVARDHRETILSALRGDWTLGVDSDVLARSDDVLDAAVCVLAGADSSVAAASLRRRLSGGRPKSRAGSGSLHASHLSRRRPVHQDCKRIVLKGDGALSDVRRRIRLPPEGHQLAPDQFAVGAQAFEQIGALVEVEAEHNEQQTDCEAASVPRALHLAQELLAVRPKQGRDHEHDKGATGEVAQIEATDEVIERDRRTGGPRDLDAGFDVVT